LIRKADGDFVDPVTWIRAKASPGPQCARSLVVGSNILTDPHSDFPQGLEMMVYALGMVTMMRKRLTAQAVIMLTINRTQMGGLGEEAGNLC